MVGSPELCHRENGSGIEGLPCGEQESLSRLELVESTSDQVVAFSSVSPKIQGHPRSWR